MQVYDLAWSPTGEYILAGSTDNIARIFSTIDGTFLISSKTLFLADVANKANASENWLSILTMFRG
jgi:WD40 repeat protein